MKCEVRFVDVYTNKQIGNTLFLKHSGQTYDIPDGYEKITKDNFAGIETVVLRKI